MAISSDLDLDGARLADFVLARLSRDETSAMRFEQLLGAHIGILTVEGGAG